MSSVDNGRSVAYTYDGLSRLSTAVTTGSTAYPQWGLAWTYDRYANRTAQRVTAGTSVPSNSVAVSLATNRITSAGYNYDPNGNMLNDGLNTLVYDAENHAVSATSSGASGTYTYDGNGNRIKKISGSTTTVYIFSGSKVVAEYDNGAAPTAPSREYVYGGAALLAKIDSSGTKYYHQDSLSNRLVTSSTGTTLEQLGHYPYGESWYNSTGDKLLFTTYERDSESGNDYAQARYYVNRLGRFSSPDPLSGSIADPQSLDHYTYAANDPAEVSDPSGLCPKWGPFENCGSAHTGSDFFDDGAGETTYIDITLGPATSYLNVDSNGAYSISTTYDPELSQAEFGTIYAQVYGFPYLGSGGNGSVGGAVNNLRTAALSRVLSKEACTKFISDLLQKLSKAQPSPAMQSLVSLSSYTNALFAGDVTLSSQPPPQDSNGNKVLAVTTGNQSTIYSGGQDLVVSMLHETFHRTGFAFGISDSQIANSLSLPYTIIAGNWQATQNNASAAWGPVLHKNCDQP